MTRGPRDRPSTIDAFTPPLLPSPSWTSVLGRNLPPDSPRPNPDRDPVDVPEIPLGFPLSRSLCYLWYGRTGLMSQEPRTGHPTLPSRPVCTNPTLHLSPTLYIPLLWWSFDYPGTQCNYLHFQDLVPSPTKSNRCLSSCRFLARPWYPCLRTLFFSRNSRLFRVPSV